MHSCFRGQNYGASESLEQTRWHVRGKALEAVVFEVRSNSIDEFGDASGLRVQGVWLSFAKKRHNLWDLPPNATLLRQDLPF